MKKFKLKNLLYLAVMVFGAFTFAGCSNDNDEENELLPYDFVYLNNLYKMSSTEAITNKLQKDGFEIFDKSDFSDYIAAKKTINGVTYEYAHGDVDNHNYCYDISFVLPSTTSDKTLKSLVDAILKSENKIAEKNIKKYYFENWKTSVGDGVPDEDRYEGYNKNEGKQKFIEAVLKREGGKLEYRYNGYSTGVEFLFNEDNSIDIIILLYID